MVSRQALRLGVTLAIGLWLGGCDDFAPGAGKGGAPSARSQPSATQIATAPVAPQAVAPGPPTVEAQPADTQPVATTAPPLITTGSVDPKAAAIEASTFSADRGGAARRGLLIKVEVLLDRAHFSPGVIDGRGGDNLKHAIAAMEKARGLPGDGALDSAVFDALTSADSGPVTQDYTITADDEKDPFLGKLPVGFVALAKLGHLGYVSPIQALAEKFHMDQALLLALNPTADFTAAGTRILVVRAGSGDLGARVTRVEVDKAADQLRAFDQAGKLVAAFPATVGSAERPAPAGEWAVRSVTANPDYTFDPTRLTFGPADKGKLTIAPGPNNPVGTTWIALTKETYGIHGSPDPTRVGKVASHGCVRLTNWDAEALGRAVKKGAVVDFVGVERRA